jgi:hypothetical protein
MRACGVADVDGDVWGGAAVAGCVDGATTQCVGGSGPHQPHPGELEYLTGRGRVGAESDSVDQEVNADHHLVVGGAGADSCGPGNRIAVGRRENNYFRRGDVFTRTAGEEAESQERREKEEEVAMYGAG